MDVEILVCVKTVNSTEVLGGSDLPGSDKAAIGHARSVDGNRDTHARGGPV